MSDSLQPHGCSMPVFSVLHHLLKFAQTRVHWVGDAIHPSRPLPSPSPSAFNHSQHQGFFQRVDSTSGGQSIGALTSASVLPKNMQTYWFDFLEAQGTLKSLKHHRLKVSILCHSAFFMIQISHLCMTTGKTIALTIWTFVCKVMHLLFNILSMLSVCHSFSSKEYSSFKNFMAAVTVCSDFGAQENRVCHCFHCFPIYLPWSDGNGCHDSFFFLIFLFWQI